MTEAVIDCCAGTAVHISLPRTGGATGSGYQPALPLSSLARSHRTLGATNHPRDGTTAGGTVAGRASRTIDGVVPTPCLVGHGSQGRRTRTIEGWASERASSKGKECEADIVK